MDVLFFYPKFPLGKKKWEVGGGSNRMYPPLDMAWIARLLKERGNTSFQILDANINRYSLDEVIDHIKKANPKIILTTTDPYETYRCMTLSEEYFSVHQEFIAAIKKEIPSVKTILVGPHGTSLPDVVFGKNPQLDFIVRGESEFTSFKLIDLLLCEAKFQSLPGISYRDKANIKHNEKAP